MCSLVEEEEEEKKLVLSLSLAEFQLINAGGTVKLESGPSASIVVTII